MPRVQRVHRVASLLKRWLLGEHQGSVAHYYSCRPDRGAASGKETGCREEGGDVHAHEKCLKLRQFLGFRLLEEARLTFPGPSESQHGMERMEKTPPTRGRVDVQSMLASNGKTEIGA